MEPNLNAELERANDALQAIGLTLQRLWGAVGEPLMINDRPVYSLRQIDGSGGAGTIGAMTKDTAHKIVAQVLREAEDRDDDFALTLAIVDALWAGWAGRAFPDGGESG